MSFGYDPARAAEVPDFDAPPAGDYKCIVTDCEDKESERTGGKYLKLTMQILDGKHKGSIITDMINYENANPKAEEIAWRTLKRLSLCVFGREDKRWVVSEIIGRKVYLKSKLDDSGDYVSARVKRYELPPGDAAIEPPTPQPKDTPIEQRVSHVGAKVPTSKPASEMQDDDDVPF
jgi:hypothetical protein